jgi:type 1 fimbria pilin
LNKNILGLISVLVLVIMVSGCSTVGKAQKDLHTVTKANYYSNNNTYTLSGNVSNNGSNAYSDVKIEVLGKDKNNQTVYNKTETINYVAPNQNTVFIFDIPAQKTTLKGYLVTILSGTSTTPR